MITGCYSSATVNYGQVRVNQLPEERCVSTVNELIEFVFAELPTRHDDAAWVSPRAILCLRKEMVNRMKGRVLDMFPGDTVCERSTSKLSTQREPFDTYAHLTFTLRRRQFPVRSAFTMTIRK